MYRDTNRIIVFVAIVIVALVVLACNWDPFIPVRLTSTPAPVP